MEATPPLIVTLKLNEEAQSYFTALRTQYFPAHANYLDAHLTMFHHLPSSEPFIEDVLQDLATIDAFALEVSEIKNIGNGVAFAITSPPLMDLHSSLQQAFRGHLISQDRHRIWPHITVQNKVTAFKAQQTAEFLQRGFRAFTIQAIGLDTWHYLKGPWQHHRTYPFNI